MFVGEQTPQQSMNASNAIRLCDIDLYVIRYHSIAVIWYECMIYMVWIQTHALPPTLSTSHNYYSRIFETKDS